MSDRLSVSTFPSGHRSDIRRRIGKRLRCWVDAEDLEQEAALAARGESPCCGFAHFARASSRLSSRAQRPGRPLPPSLRRVPSPDEARFASRRDFRHGLLAWLERRKSGTWITDASRASAFVRAVARNRLLVLAQRQRVERRGPSLNVENPSPSSQAACSSFDAEMGALEALPVARAIQKAAAAQRILLILRDNLDLPWNTVSFILRRPVHALCCLRTRALQAIRCSLEQWRRAQKGRHRSILN